MPMKPGKAVHPSNGVGTAPAAGAGGVEINFDTGPNRGGRGSTMQVIITNKSIVAGEFLAVSFASGTDGTFSLTIPPSTVFAVDVSAFRCRLEGVAGPVDYSIMGLVA